MLPTLPKQFVSIAGLSMFLNMVSVKVSCSYSLAGSQKYTHGSIFTNKAKIRNRLAPPSEICDFLHQHHFWHLLSQSSLHACMRVHLWFSAFPNTPRPDALALLRPHVRVYCLLIAPTVFSYFIPQEDFISLSVCFEKIHSVCFALTCIFAQQ